MDCSAIVEIIKLFALMLSFCFVLYYAYENFISTNRKYTNSILKISGDDDWFTIEIIKTENCHVVKFETKSD